MKEGGPFWYFFDSGARHPHDNMAMDEALLCLPMGHPVVLRFYDWEPPGRSLGYFQRYDSPPAAGAAAFGAVVTRRTTGGDAILHAGEITFSITGDEDRPPFDGAVEESYHEIHLAVAGGLAGVGVAAHLRKDLLAEPEPAAGRCFYSITPYDLVAGGRKLVGSAQRRRGGRVLHHGSIPLDPNPMTPRAAAVRGLAGRDLSREKVQAVIRKGFEKRFAISLRTWTPGEEVESEAKRIAREKYGSEAWLKRR